jgi:formiminoglutamase
MEEACQICRYAGLSDKLKAFGTFGFRGDFDRQGQTAQTTAQMIWYFLEGLLQRKGDFPASLDGLTEYIVERKGYDPPLKFWKSRRSGRWWVQVSTPSVEAGPVQQRLVPCSHNDYLAACQQDELPERILNILKRFG